ATSGLLNSMINGYRLSQMIHVVAKLHVAELLAADPMTIDELASATGAHLESLRRLLRALASFGIFSEDRDGSFRLSPWPLISRRAPQVHNGLLRPKSASRGGGRPGGSYCTACRRGRWPSIAFTVKAYLNIYERTSRRQ